MLGRKEAGHDKILAKDLERVLCHPDAQDPFLDKKPLEHISSGSDVSRVCQMDLKGGLALS